MNIYHKPFLKAPLNLLLLRIGTILKVFSLELFLLKILQFLIRYLLSQSNIGQDRKTLRFAFLKILTVIAKVSFLEWRPVTKRWPVPQHFLNLIIWYKDWISFYSYASLNGKVPEGDMKLLDDLQQFIAVVIPC